MILNVHDTPVQTRRKDVIEEIREHAELMEVSMTEAVGTAVRAQLATVRSKAAMNVSSRRKRAEAALAELRTLPIAGPGMSDDDLYGPDGLPR